MADNPTPTDKPAKKKRWPCGCLGITLCVVVALILLGIALSPITGGIEHPMENSPMQTARSVNLLLFSYANDHDGNYPDGKSSTEIFQMLLDEKYAIDPAVFYLPLPGKVLPADGQKLKPENVGFDVTSGIVDNSSDQMPVVFETGYKITYAPGAAAVPSNASGSQGVFSRTWAQWWKDEKPLSRSDGIAVAYKSNSAMFIKPDSTGAAPNFISPNFKPEGRVYRQLTPDGEMP